LKQQKKSANSNHFSSTPKKISNKTQKNKEKVLTNQKTRRKKIQQFSSRTAAAKEKPRAE